MEEEDQGFMRLVTVKMIGIFVVVFFTARHYASAAYAIVVCLCVCLSHSGTVLYQMAKRRITQIMPHDSSGTLVF